MYICIYIYIFILYIYKYTYFDYCKSSSNYLQKIKFVNLNIIFYFNIDLSEQNISNINHLKAY